MATVCLHNTRTQRSHYLLVPFCAWYTYDNCRGADGSCIYLNMEVLDEFLDERWNHSTACKSVLTHWKDFEIVALAVVYNFSFLQTAF